MTEPKKPPLPDTDNQGYFTRAAARRKRLDDPGELVETPQAKSLTETTPSPTQQNAEVVAAARRASVNAAAQHRYPPPPLRTVSGFASAPRGARPASWEKWKHIPSCELWRAVCLTFDVEPDAEVLGMVHWLQNRRAAPRGLPAEFPDRLDIAQANVSTNGPIHPHRLYVGVLRNPHAEVSLAEVAAAGIMWGWTMPEEMSALASVSATQSVPKPEAKFVGPAGAAAAPAGPLPLTTGDIAFCFAGLRWKTEDEWKKPLGDKPKWLEACIVIPGRRGVSETRWNPVCIGAALARKGHAKTNSIRSRFQTKPLLIPWLDAWKTYEADNLDTD